MFIPLRFMQVLLIAVGISLGAVVTPETLHGMATYPFSIAVLLAAMACVSYSGSNYLRLVHGWDDVTAYLAASPGGMSQVVAVGAELDADLRAIAIVQTLRVVVIAVGLPTALLALGFAGHGRTSVGGVVALSQLDELAVLIAASTVMALIAHWIRFPGGLLFGAMLTSAALHGIDYIHVVMPWWVANTVMMGFGAVIGARFANTSLRLLFDFVGAAFGSFAVALVDHRGLCRRVADFRQIAGRRSDDRLCARFGRRHDAAGARAASRPGLCRRASSDAHLLRLGHHAAGGAPQGAQAGRRPTPRCPIRRSGGQRQRFRWPFQD